MKNQCDGCNVEAPLTKRGNHKMPDGGYMACTKSRYDAPIAMGHPLPNASTDTSTPLHSGDRGEKESSTNNQVHDQVVTLRDYIVRKQKGLGGGSC